MNDWAETTSRSERASLALMYREDEGVKKFGLEILDKLGLPQWKHIALPLSEFLADPQKKFEEIRELGSDQYHVSLTSDIEGKRRLRKFPLSADQALSFIHEKVASGEQDKFLLVLKEISRNVYGGNIIINDDGSILLETAPGEHLELVTGRITPTIFGLRDRFTRALGIYTDNEGKNPLQDVDLEQILLKTVNLIPKDRYDSDGKPDYHPGYYEFVLVEDQKKGGLRSIFLDYREGEIYRPQRG